MRSRGLFVALTWLLTCAPPSDALPVGVLSFDALIPGPDGLNAFSVVNLTGDPAAGGFALPPDFPVVSTLTFLGAELTLVRGGASEVISLGDIGPGPFPDLGALLQFPDTEVFDSAFFTASLSDTVLSLAGGGTFLALGTISASLLPSGGDSLTAGLDFVLLEVTERSIAVPAPATLMLLATTLLMFAARSGRARASPGTAFCSSAPRPEQ